MVAALLVGLPLTTSAQATTAPGTQDPRTDPFYAVPSGLTRLAPGTVLASRQVTPALFSQLPVRAKAWQLLYRTTDNNGAATATVATLLVPDAAAPAAGRPRPLVSYQMAEDSNSLQCSPSHSMVKGAGFDNPVAQAEMVIISAYLARGDDVVVPDYEGPRSLYTVGVMAGHGTLDGIRAAKSFVPAGVSRSAPVGMTGYSGGALATEWAAQLQPTYAPDVTLRAVSAGGVPVNVEHMAEHIDHGPSLGALDGIVLNGITGEYKAYPGIAAAAAKYVTAKGVAIMKAINTECNQTVTGNYAFTPYTVMFNVANPLTAIPQMHSIIAANTLGGAIPAKVPTYIYESTNDEATVPADVDSLVAKDCAAGVPIDYQRDILSEHISLVATGAPAAVAWMQGTLTGATRTTTCSTHLVLSTLATPIGIDAALRLALGLVEVL